MDLSARRPGPDVVRAVAMAGVVVMNYHGYLILRGAQRGDGALDELFDPWTGPLSTRFAATFVLTAGVGVTLMTRSSIGDPDRTSAVRWRLVRRGLLLYGFGLLYDMIWRGTILPYYGAMFVIGAALITVRIRWLLAIGASAAVSAAAIRWWRYEAELDGHDTSWLTNPGPGSPRGLVIDVFVNGTHPLLPWLTFFCAGIVLGRLLTTTWWRPAAGAAGFALFALATLVNSTATNDRSLLLLSVDPFDRGLAYTASALGTALVAFAAISWIADRFADTAAIGALQQAGQMSLTIYVGHTLVFNLLVDQLDLIQPGGVGTALAFAAVYWTAATAGAIAYQRRHGRGPAEVLYRRLTG
jgi:uncharacterized protein